MQENCTCSLGGGRRPARERASSDPTLGVDNAEHLIQEVARVVHAVLEGAPGVKVLVTSRAPLKLVEEQVMRLQPLQVPPQVLPPAEAQRFSAVELFDQRVRAMDSRYRAERGQCGRRHRCVPWTWTACRWPSSWRRRGGLCWRDPHAMTLGERLA
jgi:hypothetical protein